MPQTREELAVSTCPNCGSPEIQRVRQDWSSTFQGEKYSVKALAYYACPMCAEKVYPPEAMHRIQAASPAFAKLGGRKAGRRHRRAA